MVYINSILDYQDFEKDNKCYLKETYNFDDFHNCINDLTVPIIERYNVYQIIKLYDEELFDQSIMEINADQELFSENNDMFNSSIDDIYNINVIPDHDIGRYFKLIIWYQYKMYYRSLSDIIEVGEIHE